ncbi:MAG: SRPBCC family protein [Nakamurella sp.]
MARFLVSVTRQIDAPPQALFDIVADPAMHLVIDGSGTVRGQRTGNPQRLSAGARFSMSMQVGAKYRTVSHVIEFAEGKQIAWQVGGNGAIWRYLFEANGTVGATGDGTLVTEQWDVRTAPVRWLLAATGFAGRSRRGMTATLQRLEAQAKRPDTATA